MNKPNIPENYKKFTKRFQDTKCFRLALIPQGKTSETISSLDLHGFDDAVYEKIEKLFPVIDSYLLSLINSALDIFDYPFAEYEDALCTLATAKKGSEEYKQAKSDTEIHEKNIKQKIITSICEKLPKDISGKDLNRLLTKPLLDTILPLYVKSTHDTAYNFDKGEAILNLESLKSASSSILPRFRSRKTTLETWLPEREIENYAIYRKNISLIKKLIENESIPEIHNFFSENPEFRDFVSPNNFALLMTQNGIEGYNKMINGILSENGIVSKGINMITNEFSPSWWDSPYEPNKTEEE